MVQKIGTVFHGVSNDYIKPGFKQKAVYTVPGHLQLVSVELLPNESTGFNLFKSSQTIVADSGRGTVLVGNESNNTQTYLLTKGKTVVVPAGVNHDIINGGETPLRLSVVYSPPLVSSSHSVERGNMPPSSDYQCSNESDPVTLDNINELEDVVYIKWPGQSDYTCYDRPSLLQSLQQPNSVMADWIAKRGQTLDSEGYGGKPGKKRFYKTIINYIDRKSYQLLKKGYDVFDSQIVKNNQRIGNLDGTFGIGQIHGQLPGETIYKLVPLGEPTQIVLNEELIQQQSLERLQKWLRRLGEYYTLDELKNLQRLWLNNKNLTAIPPEIGQLTNLQELILDNNQLKTIPPELSQLTDLQLLSIGYNNLTSIPPELSQLGALEQFYIHNNQLTEVPPEIGQFKNLKMLRFDNNQLTEIPAELSQLRLLQELVLDNNQLTSVPPELGQLTNFQTLDLSNNLLTTIPPELGRLNNLYTLNLSNNQLTTIPPELGQLANLMFLDLGNNQLTTIPPELGQLTNLQRLNIKGNPITTIPEELQKPGLRINRMPKWKQSDYKIKWKPFSMEEDAGSPLQNQELIYPEFVNSTDSQDITDLMRLFIRMPEKLDESPSYTHLRTLTRWYPDSLKIEILNNITGDPPHFNIRVWDTSQVLAGVLYPNLKVFVKPGVTNNLELVKIE